MRDRTFTLHLSGRWLPIGLITLLAALMVPVAVIAAGGSFTDDDTSVFEADIEWLADAGVTRGCNPPANDRFCPSQAVSRGQMAAFMRRFARFLGAEDGIVDQADQAATAHSAATANHATTADHAITSDSATTAGTATAAGTATTADQVGGFAANELVRVGGCVTIDAPDGVDYECNFDIDAPVDGVVALNGSANLATFATSDFVYCSFSVDGSWVGSTERSIYLKTGDGTAANDCVSTGVVALTAGTHKISFTVRDIGDSTHTAGVAAHGVYSAHDGIGN
jgi:hypothetical protein